MEPFSVVGVLIIAILVFFLSRFLSVVVRILFYGALVVFVLVLFFGVSLDQVIEWAMNVVMLVL